MLRRGDQGAAVERLQQALVDLGYALPRFGVDGDLGTETIDALALFLRDHGRAVDDDEDVITDEEISLLQRVAAANRDALDGPEIAAGAFHDLRASASQQHVRSRRAWNRISGITLHQTACVLGEKPARWRTVGAHVGVTRGGQVIWMHAFNRIVIHANGFNRETIGIEMDGTYAGVEGNDRTFWRPKTDPHRKAQVPTPELVRAANAAVRWICAEVARHGGRVANLFAHRQASKERQSDPGSALWQQVAMKLLEDKALGLSDGGPHFKIGDGYPIPEPWDPSRKGVKY